jgi:hypothetical protein
MVEQAKSKDDAPENDSFVKSAGPVVVSKEDRIEAENLHLRVLLCNHEIQELHRMVQAKTLQVQGLNAQIQEKRAELEKKYGIDLNTCDIRENDGVVVPKGGGMVKRLQNIQGG